MALDENVKAFVTHISLLAAKIIIHLARKAQILLFLIEKVTNLAKHLDFADIFLKKTIKLLLKRTKAN